MSDYLAARRRFLDPPWAKKQLILRDVRRVGWELAGNPGDLRLFGMGPVTWYVLGARIVGRTAVEATRDRHAAFLARNVAGTLAQHGIRIAEVIDPFVGSGNLLFHLLRATNARRAVGLDADAGVLGLTQRNFSRLHRIRRLPFGYPVFRQQDWTRWVDHVADGPSLVVVDPPWANALGARGLDVRRTEPPVAEILDSIARVEKPGPTFAMVKTYPHMVMESVGAITRDHETYPSVKSNDPAISRSVDYLLLRIRKGTRVTDRPL